MRIERTLSSAYLFRAANAAIIAHKFAFGAMADAPFFAAAWFSAALGVGRVD